MDIQKFFVIWMFLSFSFITYNIGRLRGITETDQTYRELLVELNKIDAESRAKLDGIWHKAMVNYGEVHDLMMIYKHKTEKYESKKESPNEQ